MSETQTTLREQISSAMEEKVAPESEVVVTETPVESAEAKAERARDEAGRFAKEEKAKADAQSVKASQEAQAPQRPPRPSSWKKDYEKDWETLDPRLAGYIHQREQEFAKGVSTYKTEWERAKPILEALAPFQEQFQKYGIQPDHFVRSLGAAHQTLALGTPQQKLQVFAKLAQDYGVPLQALLPRTMPDGQQVPQMDPRIAMLLQQAIAPVRQELQQFKTEQQKQQEAQMSREIEAFKAESSHEHFDILKDTMAKLLESGVATDLESAYNMAIRMPQHDDIWTAMQETKRKTEEAQRAKEAAQQAAAAKKKAVSLKTSSPGSSSGASGKSPLREQYADAIGATTGRV